MPSKNINNKINFLNYCLAFILHMNEHSVNNVFCELSCYFL
ncbi:hypothetical protein GT23_0723 [Parageobacillus thermoglucosidasius]|nr:hypothetical protein GT23_0723 [Parageobacillus thermoglucosidasius]